jgi:hypothetical protein
MFTYLQPVSPPHKLYKLQNKQLLDPRPLPCTYLTLILTSWPKKPTHTPFRVEIRGIRANMQRVYTVYLHIGSFYPPIHKQF